MSTELARLAHEAAEALQDERLERASAGKSAGPASRGSGAESGGGSGRARSHQKTTGGVKRDASSRSQRAQRQARKDAR